MAKGRNSKYTNNLDLNKNLDINHMPEEEIRYFVHTAQWIWQKREEFKATHPTTTIVWIWKTFDFKNDGFGRFFEQVFGSIDSTLKNYYKEYGKWNEKLGRKWIRKMIFSAIRNSNNNRSQKNNLELYYRACQDGYHPDRIRIESSLLVVPKDDVIEKTKFAVWDNLDIRMNRTASLKELTEIIKDNVDKKTKINNKKDKNKKNNWEYIQTELEFVDDQEKENNTWDDKDYSRFTETEQWDPNKEEKLLIEYGRQRYE